jgi:secreted trypsin-like serine protease
VDVLRVISHPSYVPSTIDYDYAILALATRLIFGTGINAISLPLPDETIEDNTYTWTSGWGRTMVADESNEQLRKVDIPIVNRERCRLAYETRNVVTERMICAGYYYDGGKDACQGWAKQKNTKIAYLNH